MPTTTDQEFIDASRRFLKSEFLPKLLHCLERLREDDIWWRPNESSNSIGNLILHLCGNVRQWIVGGLGGIPAHRDRDSEFASRGPMPKGVLVAQLEQTMMEVDGVLKMLKPDQLLTRHTIQVVYEVSALQAIYHVVEHFSYHTGQILYIYKLRTGEDLKFYKHLENQ